MRVAVMGSGGIGGYVGARLAEAGEDVSLVARGAHLEAMRRGGLRVTSPFGDLNLPHVSATDTPAEIGPVDIVVFSVKTYDSEKAAEATLPLFGPTTRVVTLQNGIDSVDTLARFVRRDQVVGGATYLSGYLGSPGHVIHLGATQIVLGGTGDPAIEALRAACNRVRGIEAQIVQDIDAVLWEKFVILSAFSGGMSLTRQYRRNFCRLRGLPLRGPTSRRRRGRRGCCWSRDGWRFQGTSDCAVACTAIRGAIFDGQRSGAEKAA